MRRRGVLLSLLVLVLCSPNPAQAWHKHGHMAVARFAWKQLDDRPQLQMRLVKILQAHAHYEIFLTQERPPNITVGEWTFVRAATWPDWVRDPYGPGLTPADKKSIQDTYSKPLWHFINLPYVHPDEVNKFDAGAIRQQALEPAMDDQGHPRHALAALKQAIDLLKAPGTDPREAAVRLCWLLHLVGDLHQPLHASALIASKDKFDPPFLPPHGDEGGNRLAVKAGDNARDAIELHTWWDALLFEEEPAFGVVEQRVTALRTIQRDQLSELATAALIGWAEESLALAKAKVYYDQGQFLRAIALPPKHKKEMLMGLETHVLSAAYRNDAAAVARRRMALAGYRLADQLRQAFQG